MLMSAIENRRPPPKKEKRTTLDELHYVDGTLLSPIVRARGRLIEEKYSRGPELAPEP
jgi:hypothetical protein